jgi:hypothetical protein
MTTTGEQLARKLQIRQGNGVRVLGDGPSIGDFPVGDDVLVIYVDSRDDLRARFAALASGPITWLCYRKGDKSLNRTTIMEDSGDFGWRPISNVAIDELWSAIRVRPLAEGEERVR